MKQDDAVQLFREARALFQDEHYDQALVLFERLAREHPDNPGMWHAHAWCLARMGRDDEARALCRKLTAAGDARASEIVAYLDARKVSQDRAERPKNPATVIGTPSDVPQFQAQHVVEMYRSKSPRTWSALDGRVREREPGGIRCARITLLVASGAGILALVFSFLGAAMLLQQQSLSGEVPSVLIAEITLVLTAELILTCLAALAWQHVPRGRIGLALGAAFLLLPVFPLGTAMSVLVLLGLFDGDSKKWLTRAAARGMA